MSTGPRKPPAPTPAASTIDQVPGQHVGLQTDDAQAFYRSLGFEAQPEFLSRVVGAWLENEANR